MNELAAFVYIIKFVDIGINLKVTIGFTDKKENKIFLIYEEIQKESVAKSYMTNGLLLYG